MRGRPAAGSLVIDLLLTRQIWRVNVTYEIKPDAATGDASGVGETGALLAGTVDPNGAPAIYRFDLGPDTSYGISTGDVSAGNGSDPVPVLAPVSGLTPGTTYHYRVVATTCGGCAAGTTAGEDRTFTTAGTAPGAGLPGGGPFAGPPGTGVPVDGPPGITARKRGTATVDRRGRFTVPGTTIACGPGSAGCRVDVGATSVLTRAVVPPAAAEPGGAALSPRRRSWSTRARLRQSG